LVLGLIRLSMPLPIMGSKKVVSTPKFLSVVFEKRRAGP
jgi:hypothetical protein